MGSESRSVLSGGEHAGSTAASRLKTNKRRIRMFKPFMADYCVIAIALFAIRKIMSA